jgi:CLN3 protein
VSGLSCAHARKDFDEFVVLYVIILSAALDLVPPSTPKGIIAFWNITPSIVAKFSWPYILKGRIRYARRLIGCCFLSVTGMIVGYRPCLIVFQA